MPSWAWYYPYGDYTSATHAVQFHASPADATCNWRIPYLDNPSRAQVRVPTADGGERVYDLSSSRRVFVLRFAALPPGDDDTITAMYGYLGMLYFLESVCLHGKLPFGFYDHVGASEIQVRYVGGIQDFPAGTGGYRSGAITLREVL